MSKQIENVKDLIDEVMDSLKVCIAPQTLKDRMGLDADPNSDELYIEARQLLEEDADELGSWAEHFGIAKLGEARHYDLMQVATAILARFDMEPVNAQFPASAMREDLRRAIAKATT